MRGKRRDEGEREDPLTSPDARRRRYESYPLGPLPSPPDPQFTSVPVGVRHEDCPASSSPSPSRPLSLSSVPELFAGPFLFPFFSFLEFYNSGFSPTRHGPLYSFDSGFLFSRYLNRTAPDEVRSSSGGGEERRILTRGRDYALHAPADSGQSSKGRETDGDAGSGPPVPLLRKEETMSWTPADRRGAVRITPVRSVPISGPRILTTSLGGKEVEDGEGSFTPD